MEERYRGGHREGKMKKRDMTGRKKERHEREREKDR